MNFLKNRTFRHLAIILAAAFLITLPIFINGIPDNYDLPEHMHFARTFYANVSPTDVMPEWSAEDNFGFGGAGVRLYPPLTYFFLTIFRAVSGSWYVSLWFLLFVCMFAGCVGAYLFVRDLYPESNALAAALIYAVLPYHLFQVYQVFLLAEYAAAAILPFCFLYAARVLRFGRFNDAVLYTAAFSALLITHIPSSIIASITLAVFILLQLKRSNLVRSISLFTFSAIASLAATSFYWVTVVTEVGWVKHDSKRFFRSGLYDYAVYLFPISVDPPEFYVLRQLWLWDVIIGLTLILFVASAALLLIRYPKEKRFEPLTAALLAAGTLALFMVSVLSTFVWSSIPFIQKLQFPWRWLAVATLTTSVVAPVAFSSFYGAAKRPGRAFGYAAGGFALALAIFNATQIIIPSAGISKEKFARQMDELYLMPACPCWWPVWADPKAFGNKEKVTIEGRTATVSDWSSTDRRFSISSGPQSEARIATFYYPHWKAKMNGTEIPVTAGNDGTIRISVPEGEAAVQLYFEEPGYTPYLNILSIIAWAAILIFLFINRLNTKNETS